MFSKQVKMLFALSPLGFRPGKLLRRRAHRFDIRCSVHRRSDCLEGVCRELYSRSFSARLTERNLSRFFQSVNRRQRDADNLAEFFIIN